MSGDGGGDRAGAHKDVKYAAMPKSLELVLATNESLTIELDPLPDAEELDVVMDVLVEEKPPAYFWTALASRCWNAGRRAEAEQIISRGCSILPVHRPQECASLFALRAAFLLAEARTAPKQVLDDARYQPLGERSPKQHYFQQVHDNWQRVQSLTSPAEQQSSRVLLQVRAVTALMCGDNALAAKLFDALLARTPSNAVALLGRACLQLRARQYLPALHTYQHALRVTLRMDQAAEAQQEPSIAWHGADPRIGIGLCLWFLGHYEAARRAWRRAAAYRPTSAPPHLLLGLTLINAAKYPGPLPAGMYGAHTQRPEDEARRAAYADGLMHIQQAWQRDKTCAMAAVVLASHLASQALHAWAPLWPAAHDMTTPAASIASSSSSANSLEAVSTALARALKLGEHAVQYADSRSIVMHAWLQYAYALHVATHLPQNASDHTVRVLALRYYGRVLEAQGRTQPMSTASSALAAAAGPMAAGTAGTTSASSDTSGYRHPLAHGIALASLGHAQLEASTGDVQGAMRTLDAVLLRPSGSAAYATELVLMAGLLLATPAAGSTAATDTTAQADRRRRARALLDRTIHTATEARALLSPKSLVGEGGAMASERLSSLTLTALARLGDDPRVRACLAFLWARSARERAISEYEAARAALPPSLEGSPLMYALELNMGALMTYTADAGMLRRGLVHLQRALQATTWSSSNDNNSDNDMIQAIKVLANYNMGLALENLGDATQARDAYAALLAAHPEYVTARVRMAVLAAQVPQDTMIPSDMPGGIERSARDVANTRFKEALSSDPGDLSVRAEYMRFLAGAYPANRHPAWAALKDSAAQLFLGADAGKAVFGSASVARRAADEARHDAYILGTLGWAYYQLGVHAMPGPNQRAERAKCMLRAADLFDKALAANPQNVFAAQGLAILVADDALGDPHAAPDVMEARRRTAAEDAAALLGKLREVRDDASVYVCQGHAFMLCGAWDRAAHVYELALTRYRCERDPAVLQYSARALYALGLQDRAMEHIQLAMAQLSTACDVLAERCGMAGGEADMAHASSSAAIEWKQVMYNRAVMSHKALQMLYDMPVEQRTSKDLSTAIQWVEQAQPVLQTLVDAAKREQLLYITDEIVEQRVKYADMSLLKQASQQLQDTLAYEQAQRDKLAQLDEKQREREAHLAQLRREKEEEHRRKAEAIAESRRRAREEASQIEYDREPSPEPRKQRAAPRKKKTPAQTDDFVAQDDEHLFEESSDDDDDRNDPGDNDDDDDDDDDNDGHDNDDDDEDVAAGDRKDMNVDANADAPSSHTGPRTADDMDQDDSDDGAATAPAPNSMRARLEALARERKKRNEPDLQRPKKRASDKASRKESKKAKLDQTSS